MNGDRPVTIIDVAKAAGVYAGYSRPSAGWLRLRE